jgi:hypothetical protein
MDLIGAAAHFLSDEKFWPELDVPYEHVENVIKAFVFYAQDQELKRKLARIHPEAAERLIPERKEKYH